MGGIDSIQNFYRFYLVPAMFHGFLNGSANLAADPPLPTNAQLYTTLTNWVEKGIAPERLDIASAATTTSAVQKTFPLCIYPLKATFVAGDAKLTASYVCR
jgi:feruloyl esterase